MWVPPWSSALSRALRMSPLPGTRCGSPSCTRSAATTPTWAGNADISFDNADWATAPQSLPPAAWGQVLLFIGLLEGQNSVGLYDLWNGVTTGREPGNYWPAFGSDLLSKDPVAADKMRLKELKNGRLAMLAIMGVAFNHVLPGSFPGCIYN